MIYVSLQFAWHSQVTIVKEYFLKLFGNLCDSFITISLRDEKFKNKKKIVKTYEVLLVQIFQWSFDISDMKSFIFTTQISCFTTICFASGGYKYISFLRFLALVFNKNFYTFFNRLSHLFFYSIFLGSILLM